MREDEGYRDSAANLRHLRALGGDRVGGRAGYVVQQHHQVIGAVNQRRADNDLWGIDHDFRPDDDCFDGGLHRTANHD